MCLVPDTLMPLDSLIERITTPTPPGFGDASTAVALHTLGHVGDAVKWFATVQGNWPPTQPRSVTVIALAEDSLRVDNSRYAIVDAPSDAMSAILAGAAAVDSAVDSGADALILQDPATLAPGTLAVIALLTSTDAAAATLRHLDATTWMHHVSAVRDVMRAGRKNLGNPVALLDSAHTYDVAVMTGALLAAAARRTPVVLDSTSSLAAALVAHRIAYRSREWWWASQRPADPAAHVALERLDMHAFVDLHLVHQSGIAPMLMLNSLQEALTRI